MSFYDNPENVNSYIEMCTSYDGSNIYQQVAKHLESGKTVLELGTGPGFDIPFLKANYEYTGSDLSEEFLNRCKERYPELPFIKFDVREIPSATKYHCIYSNKVLHHLTEAELGKSLESQRKALTKNGIIVHSFWIGEESQKIDGLLFTYYQIENLLKIIENKFNVISTMSYEEFEPEDSLLVIATAN